MWVPLTIVAIVSLLIAHMFLSVYNMAIDTIFLCFCEDCEQNDGITKPYFMSKGLMVSPSRCFILDLSLSLN